MNRREFLETGGKAALGVGLGALGSRAQDLSKVFCGAGDDAAARDTQLAIQRFPEFVLHWDVHAVGDGLDGGTNHGAEFIGENGRLTVDREGINWTPSSDHAGCTTVACHLPNLAWETNSINI